MTPELGQCPLVSNNSRTVSAPKSTADMEDNAPMNFPIGVRATAQMTALG